MAHKNKYNISIFVFILIFLTAGLNPSYALLSMSEVEYLFEQEKGHSWDKATSEEKKDFLQKIRGREEDQEGIVKDKQEGDGPATSRTPTIFDGREEKTPYRIRASFEAERGIEWEEGTEEEQKNFEKTFKVNEKVYKKNEEGRLRLEELDEKRRRQELKLKKRQIELKKKLRLQEEKRIRIELKRKRDEEERKLKMKKQELKRLQQESKRKHP